MTVLVTGASGFVGAAIARALSARYRCAGAAPGRRAIPAISKGLPSLAWSAICRIPHRSTGRYSGCEALFHAAADYRLWVPDPAPCIGSMSTGTRPARSRRPGWGQAYRVHEQCRDTGDTERRTAGRRDDAIDAGRHDRPVQAIEVSWPKRLFAGWRRQVYQS